MRSMARWLGTACVALGMSTAAGCVRDDARPEAPVAEDSGIDAEAIEFDSVANVGFVIHAGDRQRLLRGPCPGPGCEVGIMVRLDPAERANEQGDTMAIVARMINEDSVYWADPGSGLSFGPRGSGFDTVYVKVHSPTPRSCTVEYSYRADARAVRGDSIAAGRPESVRPPTCTLPGHGIKWKQPTARFEVGSTAVWMSCRRGCCRAA